MSKKAGDAFFRHIKSKSQAPSVLKKMVKHLDNSQYAMPKSLALLSRFRPEELNLKDLGRAVRLQLPENKLMQTFYDRYPEARLEPVSLQSFQPPIAKQFAAKQLSLMQSMIMSEKAAGNQAPNTAAIESKAFREAEAHFKQQITALRRQGALAVAHVHLVQAEEEKALRGALEEAAARRVTGR